MSHILSNWLNTDVGLSRRVHATELDATFKDGYLLAEVLHKYDLIDNFPTAFTTTQSLEASIKNFITLERALREKLGLILSPNTAYDIILGKSGCAAKLLYEVKTSLPKSKGISGKKRPERHHPTIAYDQSQDSTPTADSSPNASRIPSAQSQFSGPGKRRFMEKEHQFFAERLKAKLRKSDRDQELNQRRQLDEVLPSLKKLTSTAVKVAPQIATPPAPQPTCITPQISDHQFDLPLDQSPIINSLHKAALSSRPKALPTKQLKTAYEKEIQAKIEQHSLKKANKIISNKEETAKTLVNDIESFETQLAALPKPHIKDGEEDDQESSLKLFVRVKAHMNPSEHIKGLQKLLPRQAGLAGTKEYLEKIRSKKALEALSRKEREQRRRKLILSQQAAQSDLEKSQVEEFLLQKVLRRSKQERRISEQLMQTRREKELILSNRRFRDEQYSLKRQKDFEDALEMEKRLCQRLKEDYKRDTDLVLSQHREILDAKSQAKRESMREWLGGVISGVGELAIKIGEYRALNDGIVPKPLLREWKTLFLSSQSVSKNYILQPDEDMITFPNMLDLEELGKDLEEDELVLKGIQVLDDAEFNDYLEGNNEWNYTTESSDLKSNPYLGTIVSNILELNAPPLETIVPVAMPKVPLKLSIIGKKLSGKGSIARWLAKSYGIAVIDADELVKKGLNGDLSDHQDPKSLTSKKLTSSLLSGESLDDATVVSLVIAAIKDHAESGFILLDFPRTRVQAALLERELSGYEDPKPPKIGGLKRSDEEAKSVKGDRDSFAKAKSAGKDKEDKNSKGTPRKKVSGIAPTPSEKSSAATSTAAASDPSIQRTVPYSGLDAVLLLEVDNEILIKRATGRKIDPVTDIVYHLEFNPPPVDQPGIMERLVSLEDENTPLEQLQYIISVFEDQESGLKEWFSRFNNLYAFDGAVKIDEVQSSVMEVLNPIIGKKEKERAELIEKILAEEKVKEVATPISVLETEEGSVPIEAAKIVESSELQGRQTSASEKRTLTPLTNPVSTPPSRVVGTGGFLASDSILENPPASVARSFGADGRKMPSRELALLLGDQWATIEGNFTNTLKFAFRAFRRERENIIRYFYSTKVNFKRFLERPDKKQVLLEIFQKEFNDIEDDLRNDADAKAELHMRADDMREKLWDLSDQRKEEAEIERQTTIEDRWVEDHYVLIQNIFITLMQLEVDRYLATKQLIIDYFKDGASNILEDVLVASQHPVRLQLVTTAPPELTNLLFVLTLGEPYLQKTSLPRSSSVAMPQTETKGANQKDVAVKKDKATTPSKKEAGKNQYANKTTTATGEKGGLLAVAFNGTEIDMDNVTLTADIEIAYLLAIGVLSVHDEVIPAEKDKAVKKRPTNADLLTETKLDSENVDLSPEYRLALDTEEQLFKRRMERIRTHAVDQLKELRVKAVEAYQTLDDCINQRYSAEMEAIKDMLAVVKEAIEVEVRLPNELVLEGEKFKVNFSVITYELEPEPRPESPVERKSSDHFTVLQLINLARRLREYSPNGIITTKEFTDSIAKLANLFFGLDLIPEVFDHGVLQHIGQSLDHYESGFINWRRFLMIQSRVLPVPTLEYIGQLKAVYETLPSYNNGSISFDDFSSIPLWFEIESEEMGGVQFDEFDRVAKLKHAMFHFFGVRSNPTKEGSDKEAPELGNSYIGEHDTITPEGCVFDAASFFKLCCLDETPRHGLQKAFLLYSDRNDGLVTLQQLYQLLHNDVILIDETHRIAGVTRIPDPYPMEILAKIFDDLECPQKDGSISFNQMQTLEAAQPVLGTPIYGFDDMFFLNKSRRSSG